MRFDSILTKRARNAESSLIDDLFQLIQGKTDIISFAAGAPDTAVLPVAALPVLNERAIERYGPALLQYGLTQGSPPLRSAILPILQSRGVTTDENEVHIATGASGALNNVCMALLEEGDTVLVEAPTYSPALAVFRSYGAEVISIETDDEGMIPQALEDALKAGRRAKFVYVLPTFQNPTGRCMGPDRRRQLGAMAQKHDVLIIEDDVYFELRYDGDTVPALYSYAPQNVVYLTSMSKVFGPAFRIGIAVMPADLMKKVLLFKQGIDMQTSVLSQALTVEFLSTTYESHLEDIVNIYRQKRDAMISALENHMPPDMAWKVPDGGMFVWLSAPPDSFDVDFDFLQDALGVGVAFVPGYSFYGDGLDKRSLRLSFAGARQDTIDDGIERLASVCNKRL